MVKLVGRLPNVPVDISLLVVGVDSVVDVVVIGGEGVVVVVVVVVEVVSVVFSLVFLDVVTNVVGTKYTIGIFSSQFIILHFNQSSFNYFGNLLRKRSTFAIS